MVARLFRLRLTLLAGEFRGSFGRFLKSALLTIVLLGGAVALAALPLWLLPDPEHRALIDTILATLVLAGALLVPVFENRRHLEPRQLAQLPAKHSTVALSMLVTTTVSGPFLLLLVWLVALGVLRPEWRGSAWAVPVAFVLAALLALCAARVASAASKLLVGDAHAGAVRAAGLILLVASLPLVVFVSATTFNSYNEQAAGVVEVLGWTPFGAPVAALEMLAAGDASAALLRFAVVGGAIVLLLALWFPLVKASNERVEKPVSPAVARRGLGWFERFAARPTQVIAARTLTYWARDPRYRVALFAIPFAPILMLLALWVAGADLHVLALIPLPVILLLLGWSLHNDVAMDSTAIWEHVASGIRGREDRAGRLAPVLFIGLPVLLVGSSITVTVVGEWRILPAVVGMNLAVLLVAAGVSSVFSALMPYPTTRPGDSPFVQPQWSGSGSGLAQTLSMLLALVLSVPPVWYGIAAVTHVEFTANMWALGFGALYGLVVLLLGVLIGGKIFDRGSSELIAVTQVFD